MQANGTRLQHIFSYGFRPLFLLAGLHALISIPLWTLYWSGHLGIELQRAGPYFHGHEMISGFVAAAMAGFLLTAVANWTQRPPVAGWPLALLCGLWLAGRLAFNHPWAAAAADLAFWSLLTLLVARELIQAGNRRNYKLLLVLALFLLSDAFYHIAELGGNPAQLQPVVWFQLLLTIILINLIGGRIIPAFTGNWLRNRALQQQNTTPTLPPAFNRLDLCATFALLAFIVILLTPDAPERLQAGLAAVACLLQFLRLSRWKALHTRAEPLIWMMHLAYLWIPLGLGLWALALIGLIPVSAALHALAGGTVAGMIMAVSSRATLGHSGQELHSSPLLTTAVLLLSLATIFRVVGSISGDMIWLQLSALSWTVAFSAWLWCFVPILLGRADAAGER